jgi:hypothetical protein
MLKRISLTFATSILVSACSTGPAYIQPTAGETATVNFSVKFNSGSYNVSIHECTEESCNSNYTRIIAGLETGLVKHIKPKKGSEYQKVFSEKESATVIIPANKKFIFSVFAKSVADYCIFNAYINSEANVSYEVLLETQSSRCNLKAYEIDSQGQRAVSNNFVITK